MSQDKEVVDLLSRLKKHPKLLSRVESLLAVVENSMGDIQKAAEAEMLVIEEVRKMGQEALTAWANNQVEKVSAEADQQEGVRRAGKKNSTGIAPLEKLK